MSSVKHPQILFLFGVGASRKPTLLARKRKRKTTLPLNKERWVGIVGLTL
jgi:hypothetical protein